KMGATQRVRGVLAPGSRGRDGRHQEHPTVLQLRHAQARVVRCLGSDRVALRHVHGVAESRRPHAVGRSPGRRARGRDPGAGGLPSALPMTLATAVDEATRQGPAYRLARANERQAAAIYHSRLGTLLPRLSLTGVGIAYDNRFYPTSAKFTQLTLTATLPIWDNFQRQNLISQARVNRDIFRAARDSAERSVQRDVVAAYDGFTTARATADFAGE